MPLQKDYEVLKAPCFICQAAPLLSPFCVQPKCPAARQQLSASSGNAQSSACLDPLSEAHPEGDTPALWLQELYSKDTHFVLELVQNADDNAYAPGQLPALEFVLEEGRITVLNNEVCLPVLQESFGLHLQSCVVQVTGSAAGTPLACTSTDAVHIACLHVISACC